MSMTDFDDAVSNEQIPEDGVLTGFVIVVEYLDPTGDRLYLTYDTSENATVWQVLGWLRTATLIYEEGLIDQGEEEEEEDA